MSRGSSPSFRGPFCSSVFTFTGTLAIFTSMLVLFMLTVCEAKSFKAVVGYEGEVIEIPLSPGRIASQAGEMPLPTSPEMNVAFPMSRDIPTVVPGKNPPAAPSVREPVEDSVPQMDGGFPLDNGIPTARSLQTALDLVGRVIVAGVNFEFDSADLTADSVPSLKAVLEYLKDNPGVKITIEGHCDTSGDTSLNPVLSQNRANSVKNWLVQQGADGSRLSSVGMSDSRPIADNSTPEGQAKNRRVELVKE